LTVTAAVPDDVSVNDWAAEEFTVTLPKLNELALIVSCGVVAAAAPVPLKDTVFVLLLAELLIVSFPVADPVAVGANCTVSVRVCFGFNVAGRLPPAMLKPDPVIDAELTVTASLPDDVSVNDVVAEEPTVTLPKLSEVALTANSGFALAARAYVPDAREQTASRSTPHHRPRRFRLF
jgi:hypothetical protein